MPTDAANIFRGFVAQLDALTGVGTQKIETALDVHGGLSGILQEEWFILGYEQLGWLIAKELTIEELKTFGIDNTSLLIQDKGAMYFFTQALMEKDGISNEQRLSLVPSMPKQYRKFLLRRFGLSPTP